MGKNLAHSKKMAGTPEWLDHVEQEGEEEGDEAAEEGRDWIAPGLVGQVRSLKAESLKTLKLRKSTICFRSLKDPSVSHVENKLEGSQYGGGCCDGPGESRGEMTEVLTRMVAMEVVQSEWVRDLIRK